jgi:hypothetical protein
MTIEQLYDEIDRLRALPQSEERDRAIRAAQNELVCQQGHSAERGLIARLNSAPFRQQ